MRLCEGTLTPPLALSSKPMVVCVVVGGFCGKKSEGEELRPVRWHEREKARKRESERERGGYLGWLVRLRR